MSKKDKKDKKPIFLRRLRNYKPVQVDLLINQKMRYKDLQRACIVRGMDFDILVQCDIHRLQSWLVKHFEDDVDPVRLDNFDSWREGYMKAQGIDEPFVRLGYVAETDDITGEIIKRKKLRNIKKPKFKRERNTQLGGIFKGTKKELTYQCELQGKTLEDTISIVTEKFPEAVEKSIRIWYKKSKRARGSNK